MEERPSDRRRLRGVGRPDPCPRHPGEERVDRSVGEFDRARSESARFPGPAIDGGGFGRDQQRHRTWLVARQDDVRRIARTDQVAGPPARLGQIQHPVRIQAADTGQRLQLRPRQCQRTEPKVGTGQGQIRASGHRDLDLLWHDPRTHAGSRRRASRPRR